MILLYRVFCRVTNPFPINLISSSKSYMNTHHMYRVNNFNPVFYTNLDTWLGLHHSCFHVTSLLVCPFYWTFTGRAISSLSCMSRASIVYTSRTSSLFMGHIQLSGVGEYEREIHYLLMKNQTVHASCTLALLVAMPVHVAPC